MLYKEKKRLNNIENINNNSCNNNKPFFSICISVYNQENHIQRCLLSILNQSFYDFELIIVDDGSEDNSVLIIEEFQKRDKRIRIIKNEKNCSLVYSRIEALKIIKGEFVLFVDPDDYIEEGSLFLLFSFLNNSSINMLEFSYCEEPSKIIVSYESAVYDLTEQILLNKYPHTIWNKCYSNKLINNSLKNAEQFYCNISEDRYFSTLFSLHLTEGFFRTKLLVYHYVNNFGISTSKDFGFDKLKNAIKSLKNKDNALKKLLINLNRKDYIRYLSEQSDFDIMFVFFLCVNSEDGFVNKIRKIKYIDKAFGTKLVYTHFPKYYIKRFIKKFVNDQN